MKARLIFHALAILGLTAMVVFAQEPAAKSAKETPKASAQDGGQAGSSLKADIRRRFNGGSTSGQSALPATGFEQVAAEQTASLKVTPHQTSTSAKNSAHATEPLSATNDAGNEANKEKQTSGENPLFEAELKNKDAVLKKPDSGMNGARNNPMYKDSGMQGTNPLFEPKDATKQKPASGSGTSNAVPGDDNDPKRHHAGNGGAPK